MTFTRRSLAASALALAAILGPMALSPAFADARSNLTENGIEALHKLTETEPKSRLFARHAKAVLIFPSVLKAGFVFGGETGNGVLLVDGKAVGYYNLTGGSWGLQIGAQDFGYALFFMKDSALDYLKKADGWSAGTGPSVVVVNKGAAVAADTTTVSQDVYAFPFGAKGLMADVTLQGTKITKIHPK